MKAAPATASMETPIGMIMFTASAQSLLSVRILARPLGARHDATHPVLEEAMGQFKEWFAGRRTLFTLPLAPAGSIEGEKLRAAIASIPYGETATYGALAARCGTIARAIGQACKTNPFPLLIPCHRVVSTAGREYYSAGAGPETKAWLLDFEALHAHGMRRRLL